MPKKQSINAKFQTAMNRMAEMTDRLESMINRLIIRLEALESQVGIQRPLIVWTWADAGIDADIVSQLEQLHERLTGRLKIALKVMIDTRGRMSFTQFARCFDDWIEVSDTGTQTVSDSKWGSCRRDLNREFEAAEILIQIVKKKHEDEVVLRLIGD